MLSLIKCSQSAWKDACVCVKVSKAAVLIDKSCAECLHWNGGATLHDYSTFYFNAGASNIKEFSSFEVIISDSL